MKRFSVVLAVFLALPGLFMTTSAAAQRDAQPISERTYQQLNRVHALMQKGRYADALAGLDRLRPRVRHRRDELALVLQSYAHLYATREKYPQAIDALTECLALEALPDSATMRALYSLAQLQMVVADYPAAVTTLERWFGLQRNPAPAARALAGTAYAQVQRYPEAVEQLSAAIEQADRPQENWYRQLLAVRYQARQYTAAAELLQRMILLFPERKDYWLQLSGVYAETGNQTQSVAVLELAYLQGVLTEERDLLNLAQHYLYTGLAHKAGQLLERSLRDGTVTATRENWALLVDAWLHARETDRALGAVERALESVAHADLHLRHAQLLADKEDWSEVVRATELALAGDALTRRGTAHLLAGIAHFHLQHPREARSCFERAREFDRSRHQAEQWLQHLATSQLYAGSHSPQRLSP
jgi:tetratricopeptide (TPR) repeat protein